MRLGAAVRDSVRLGLVSVFAYDRHRLRLPQAVDAQNFKNNAVSRRDAYDDSLRPGEVNARLDVIGPDARPASSCQVRTSSESRSTGSASVVRTIGTLAMFIPLNGSWDRKFVVFQRTNRAVSIDVSSVTSVAGEQGPPEPRGPRPLMSENVSDNV